MLEKFLTIYQKLSTNNLELLREVYASEVCFIDPAHEISGLEELIAYFKKLYCKLNSINFEYHRIFVDGNHASIYWEMSFQHPNINAGKTTIVNGSTLLIFDQNGMVKYHRDYFDLGEMLYEHLPLIGRVITYVKRQLKTVR